MNHKIRRRENEGIEINLTMPPSVYALLTRHGEDKVASVATLQSIYGERLTGLDASKLADYFASPYAAWREAWLDNNGGPNIYVEDSDNVYVTIVYNYNKE